MRFPLGRMHLKLVVACVVLLGAWATAAAANTPGIIAQHFELSISSSQAFSRADDALRAAGLSAESVTSISRGGYDGNFNALIHCIADGRSTKVDIEVAYNASNEAGRAKLDFLVSYMRTGRAPGAGAGAGAAGGGGAAGGVPGRSFAGEWDTRSTPGVTYRMHLKQKGNSVTGSYDGSGSGTITGTVSGSVLRFQWTQGGKTGAGKYTLSSDGSSFTGSYSNSDNSDQSDGYWNGKRL